MILSNFLVVLKLFSVFSVSASFVLKKDVTETKNSDASLESFPFLVVVDSQTVCSGILISDEYVLCPATCVNGTTWGTKIYLGSKADAFMQPHVYKNTTEVILSEEIIIHDKFLKISNRVYMNNIALIHLSRKVKLSKTARPAVLLESASNNINEAFVNVTGWYTTLASNLQIVKVQLMNLDMCEYYYGEDFFANQEMCLIWNQEDHHLNLTGNIVTIDEKVLGFIIRAPCVERELNRCDDYEKIIKVSSFLNWISLHTKKSLEELTGVKEENQILMTDTLKRVLEYTRTEETNSYKLFRRLDSVLKRILNDLEDIKNFVYDICVDKE